MFTDNSTSSFQGGTIVELVNTNLGPGDSVDIVIDWPGTDPRGIGKDWSDVRGVLYYAGLDGNEWKAPFTITVEGSRGRRQVRVGETEMTKRAGKAIPVEVGLDRERWYTPAERRPRKRTDGE